MLTYAVWYTGAARCRRVCCMYAARMLTYADVCCRMLTYAVWYTGAARCRRVCCMYAARMLTYADVCCRMLTYADVCCGALQAQVRLAEGARQLLHVR
jgi:hypothetical protein